MRSFVGVRRPAVVSCSATITRRKVSEMRRLRVSRLPDDGSYSVFLAGISCVQSYRAAPVRIMALRRSSLLFTFRFCAPN